MFIRFQFSVLTTIVVLLLIALQSFKSFANEEKLYQKLLEDWPKIFPDGNRNAAGPRFFKYIVDQNLNHDEFINFNKLYCSVSGSLISPNTQPDEIYLTDVDTNQQICGQYYKCCWPCLCDVMKYASTKRINLNFIATY